MLFLMVKAALLKAIELSIKDSRGANLDRGLIEGRILRIYPNTLFCCIASLKALCGGTAHQKRLHMATALLKDGLSKPKTYHHLCLANGLIEGS